MKLLNSFEELRSAHQAAVNAESEFRRPNTRALNRAIDRFCADVRELREIYALHPEVAAIVAVFGEPELNRVLRDLDLDDLIANRQLTLREAVVAYKDACDFVAAAAELADIHGRKSPEEFSRALGFLAQEGREPLRRAIDSYCYAISAALESGSYDDVASRSFAAVQAILKAGEDATIGTSVLLTVALSKRHHGRSFQDEVDSLPQSMREFISRAIRTGLFGASDEESQDSQAQVAAAFERRQRFEAAPAEVVGLDSETEADVDAALAAAGLL